MSFDHSRMSFDHIGIVAAELAQGRRHLRDLFGIGRWTEAFADPLNRVHVQFGRDASNIVYELIAPLGDQSPIAGALASGRNILNHVAYLAPDLAEAARHLQAAGCAATGQAQPAVAYQGQPIQFFLTPLRFIVEVIEAPGHRHAYTQPDGGPA